MEIYGKSLVYTIFLIIILFTLQYFLGNTNSQQTIDHFDNPIGQTYIQSMIPNEGDSSTLVKLEGVGFKYVSKIYLKLGDTYAQTIILETRSDTLIELLPPPITELGKTLLDIRRSIKNKKEGLKVEVVFVRGSKTEDGFKDISLDTNDKNTVLVKDLHFYYIDKLPYQNNCEKPPESQAPGPSVEPETDNLPDLPPVAYDAGTDLEFLNKTLPEREKKLQEIYNSIMGNLDKITDLGDNQIKQLSKLQALDSLEEIKKQFNYERYIINQELSKNLKNPNS